LQGVDPRVRLADFRPLGMDITPRAPFQEHGKHACPPSRNHVVIEAISDIRDPLGRHPAASITRSKKLGDGFSTPHAAEAAMNETGKPRRASAISLDRGWFPARPIPKPASISLRRQSSASG
jgi:hypothetical protein